MESDIITILSTDIQKKKKQATPNTYLRKKIVGQLRVFLLHGLIIYNYIFILMIILYSTHYNYNENC